MNQKILNNMTWKDISLEQFNRLSSITTEDEIDKVAQAIDILIPQEVPALELPYTIFQKLLKEISFLNEEVPNRPLADVYNLNGTKYVLKGNIFSATTSQIMDFREIIKPKENSQVDYASALACFMIPENHKYNDGYDMDKTVQDINSMCIVDAVSIFNFFLKSFRLSTRILGDFFLKQLKGLKLKTTEQKNEIERIEKTMKELMSLDFFL